MSDNSLKRRLSVKLSTAAITAGALLLPLAGGAIHNYDFDDFDDDHDECCIRDRFDDDEFLGFEDEFDFDDDDFDDFDDFDELFEGNGDVDIDADANTNVVSDIVADSTNIIDVQGDGTDDIFDSIGLLGGSDIEDLIDDDDDFLGFDDEFDFHDFDDDDDDFDDFDDLEDFYDFDDDDDDFDDFDDFFDGFGGSSDVSINADANTNVNNSINAVSENIISVNQD